jgi:hypothetical protein
LAILGYAELMTRKSFMRSLIGLPMIAGAAPLVQRSIPVGGIATTAPSLQEINRALTAGWISANQARNMLSMEIDPDPRRATLIRTVSD